MFQASALCTDIANEQASLIRVSFCQSSVFCPGAGLRLEMSATVLTAWQCITSILSALWARWSNSHGLIGNLEQIRWALLAYSGSPASTPRKEKKLCGTVYNVQSCNTCIGWVRLKAGSTKRFYIRGSCENEELVKGGMVGEENWPLSISRFSLALTCQKMSLLNKVIFKIPNHNINVALCTCE